MSQQFLERLVYCVLINYAYILEDELHEMTAVFHWKRDGLKKASRFVCAYNMYIYAQFHKCMCVCWLPVKDVKVTSTKSWIGVPPKLIGLTYITPLWHTFCLLTISGMKLAMYQSIPFWLGPFSRRFRYRCFCLRGLDLRFSNVTSEAAFCGDFFRERYSVQKRFHVVSNDLRNSGLYPFLDPFKVECLLQQDLSKKWKTTQAGLTRMKQLGARFVSKHRHDYSKPWKFGTSWPYKPPPNLHNRWEGQTALTTLPNTNLHDDCQGTSTENPILMWYIILHLDVFCI